MKGYKINEKDALNRLSEKYKKLKEAFDTVSHRLRNSSKSNSELHIAVKKATKAMQYAVQKENFLRERIIAKYGRAAFLELMNHVECPGGFDVQKFNESTENIKAKHDRPH